MPVKGFFSATRLTSTIIGEAPAAVSPVFGVQEGAQNLPAWSSVLQGGVQPRHAIFPVQCQKLVIHP